MDVIEKKENAIRWPCHLTVVPSRNGFVNITVFSLKIFVSRRVEVLCGLRQT